MNTKTTTKQHTFLEEAFAVAPILHDDTFWVPSKTLVDEPRIAFKNMDLLPRGCQGIKISIENPKP